MERGCSSGAVPYRNLIYMYRDIRFIKLQDEIAGVKNRTRTFRFVCCDSTLRFNVPRDDITNGRHSDLQLDVRISR